MGGRRHRICRHRCSGGPGGGQRCRRDGHGVGGPAVSHPLQPQRHVVVMGHRRRRSGGGGGGTAGFAFYSTAAAVADVAQPAGTVRSDCSRWVVMVSSLTAAEAQDGSASQVLTLKTAFGTDFDAYAVGPADAPRAVLLLHDRFGMSTQVRDWAARFAAQGYRALAIDLSDGRRAKKWPHATSIMSAIDPEAATADIAAALNYLTPEERKVENDSWDYGATQALLATIDASVSVAATVAFYPTALVTNQDQLQLIANPVLVVVAERDQQLGNDQILAFKDGMSKTRVDFNVMALDAERGFINPLSDDYSADNSRTAWDVTQEFLTRYLAQAPAAPVN